MSRRTLRRLAQLAAALALAVVAALAAIKLLYGGGVPYPSVATAPRVAAADVAVLAELDLPPGNVTRSRSGRVFFNLHPFYRADRFTSAFVFELEGGVPRPYPGAETQPDLAHVFGLTVDAQDRLWLISPAALDRASTRLQAFDLATGARVVDHWFEPGVARFSQDLRISPDGRTAYLADTGMLRFTRGSILVVDTTTFQVREVLGRHSSTQPQGWTTRTRAGPNRLGFGLLTMTVGVDGIALSEDGAWLYYGAMNHDTLYRVRTSDLRDASLSDAALEARVEAVGRKPLSDGIEVAPDGSVLLTDIENGGVARLDAAGGLETLVRLDGVVWADGVAVTGDGDVLFTDSALGDHVRPFYLPPARERLAAGGPYRLYRFRLPARLD